MEDDRALTTLREQYRDLALLSRVAVAANEATSASGAVEEIVAMLAVHVGWPAATAWVLDADGQLRCSGSWYQNGDPRLVALRDVVDARLVVEPGSLAARVALTGAPIWIEDVRHETTPDGWLSGRVPAGIDLGVASAFVVPVWSGPNVVGALGMFDGAARSRDDAVLELVEQVATQLGCALGRLATGPDRRSPDGLVRFGATTVDRRMLVAIAGQMWQALSGVAHEVRTPLNGILGAMELLAEADELTPESSALLEGARAAALQLHDLVELRLGAVETELAAALWSVGGSVAGSVGGSTDGVPEPAQPAAVSSIR